MIPIHVVAAYPLASGFKDWYGPDITQLPGGATYKAITNGIAGFVLVTLMVGLLVAVGAWALGAATGNIQLAERGKQGTLAAFLLALLVGAAAIILDFFFSLGSAVH